MKTVNFILGFATAVILSALIGLGIKAFYPTPTYPAYPTYPEVPMPLTTPCAPTDTVCLSAQSAVTQAAQQKSQALQDQYDQAQQSYENQMQVYNRNLFIIANILGIIVFAIGFWLVFLSAIAARGIPIGIMVAGLWSIIYGYASDWDSTNNQLKFFIGLVIAVLVIGGSAWLMQRHAKNQAAI